MNASPGPSWFTRRGIMRGIAVAAVLLASPYILVMGLMGWHELKLWNQRRPFDGPTWKSSLAVANDPLRIRMIDDLMARHRLKGMSRAQIVDLLGTPPPTNYFNDYALVYWLGPERGFAGIDSEWLAIRFDSTDHASAVDVVTD